MTVKDKEIWESYTRGVIRAPEKKIVRPRKKLLEEKREVRKNAEKTAPTIQAPLPISTIALERKREKALRQGDIDIEAKLDLHGMTQVEAFEKLSTFMQRQTKTGKRNLLIVTGKGRGGEGVLRRNLKDWLSQLHDTKQILAVRQASQKHGGDGAFYVLLRKTKLT